MKIFRAIHISLKEWRRPSYLTRIISIQYPNILMEISPCEYKIKNIAKFKDKCNPSKLNKLLRSIRRFSSTGHWKASTTHPSPFSGLVFDISKSNIQNLVSVPMRLNSSYRRDDGLENRGAKQFYEIQDLEIKEESMPVTTDGLLETTGNHNANKGLKTFENGVGAMQANALETVGIVSSKAGKRMSMEENQHNEIGITKQQNYDTFLERHLSNDSMEESITQSLHSFIYAQNNLNSFQADTSPQHSVIDLKCKKLFSMTWVLACNPLSGLHAMERSNYLHSNHFHTLNKNGQKKIEDLSVLPVALSKAVNFHSSHSLENSNRNVLDDWFVNSKKISPDDGKSSKGSGFVNSIKDVVNSPSLQHKKIVYKNDARTEEDDDVSALSPKPAVPQTRIPLTPPQAAYSTLSNPSWISKHHKTPDSDMMETSDVDAVNSDVDMETSDENDASFRSAVTPEYVQPYVSSYEAQFDDEETPHVALLCSFCSPLSSEESNENIIPIRVVDNSKQSTEVKTLSSSNGAKHGLMKILLNKLNLKWSK